MKQKRFDKTAAKDVFGILKAHIVEHKSDLDTTYVKELETKVKEIKKALGRVNSAIEGLSLKKSNDPILSILLNERIRLEKLLQTTRESIKSEMDGIHYSKEMVRHLEHALSVMRKEFAQ